MHKFFGILLYLLGGIFALALLSQIVSILSLIVSFIKIFTGSANAEQIGFIIGQIVYYMFHISIIYFSFKYGHKLFQKKTSQTQEE